MNPVNKRNKALFLDLDDTLCDTSGADVKAVDDFVSFFKNTHDSNDGLRVVTLYLDALYGRDKTIIAECVKADCKDELAWRSLIFFQAFKAATLGLGIDAARRCEEIFWQLRLNHYALYEGVVSFLKELKERYCLIVLTNGPLYSQLPRTEKTEIAHHVDHVILGGAVGSQKPDGKIFSIALEKTGLEKSNVMHIGDSLNADILGASNFGIKSIWINHGKELPDNLDFSPTESANHFLNLKTRLLAPPKS